MSNKELLLIGHSNVECPSRNQLHVRAYRLAWGDAGPGFDDVHVLIREYIVSKFISNDFFFVSRHILSHL